MAENATHQQVDIDYTLANPDTLTKYKTAAEISQKVLAAVSGWCTEGAKIVEICQKGDKMLEEEISKVFKGKKITKGIAHPTTVSPSSYVTPYTPLVSDVKEAETTISKGELVKVQLGAQIDGFGTIVCDNIIVGRAADEKVTGRMADLLLATHYSNELMLRLMLPPGIMTGTENEKAPTQARISQLLEKVAKTFGCEVVESTTTWKFDRNEIEGDKKIIVSPASGSARGEGVPDLLEAWGVEVGLSLGSGKVKELPLRATLHRRTTTTYLLKRPSSRQTLSEIVKRFGTFPFSLRQMEDEKAAKVGVVECVRGGVVRQYEPSGEADGSPVSRLFTTIAITKNGVQRLAAPPALDLSLIESDKKLEDEEILKILGKPLSKSSGSKSKKKNKNKKKASSSEEEGEKKE
ncbi:Curved DNA-binding protein (42 kDa protein) [Ascosphaera aggregata]|nr:Curved DNA-binding protein (42 kDa protein) [Ascosphaera aggregata]